LPFPFPLIHLRLPGELCKLPQWVRETGHQTHFGTFSGKSSMKHFRVLISCMSDAINYIYVIVQQLLGVQHIGGLFRSNIAGKDTCDICDVTGRLWREVILIRVSNMLQTIRHYLWHQRHLIFGLYKFTNERSRLSRQNRPKEHLN